MTAFQRRIPLSIAMSATIAVTAFAAACNVPPEPAEVAQTTSGATTPTAESTPDELDEALCKSDIGQVATETVEQLTAEQAMDIDMRADAMIDYIDQHGFPHGCRLFESEQVLSWLQEAGSFAWYCDTVNAPDPDEIFDGRPLSEWLDEYKIPC
jgi:hypothetical protein